MATPEDVKKDRALDHQNSAPHKLGPSAPSCRPPAGAAAPPDQQPPPALRCPRCDSTNTKFCYYNNYSLSQPRHFCKTCRRYWTKGGALRNVPIGGGCRKNKKLKSSSPSVSRLSSAFDPKLDSSGASAASPSSSTDVTGFRFFPPSLPPPMDFQLSGLPSAFDRLPMPFSPFVDAPNGNSRFTLEVEPPIGFNGNNYPLLSSSYSSPSIASGLILSNSTTQEMPGSLNIQGSLTSSIESLSSLNQDLHWKLQQQRLAMLLGPIENNAGQKEAAAFFSQVPSTLERETQVVHKPQPVPFQNQEFMPVKSDNSYSRKEGDTAATEWFFGNSYNSLIPDSAEDGGNGNRSVQTWRDSSNLHEFGTNLP